MPEQDRLTWALAALAVLNVALFWICIPYRTQQRFMLQALGLAAVPLARLLDRWRGLRVAAAALLILHLLTTQTWPVALEETKIPWDLSPIIPNAVGASLPLFSRMGHALSRARIPRLLPASCFCSAWVAARDLRSGRAADKRLHWPRTEEPCPAGSRRSGTCRSGRTADGGAALDARQLFYPPFRMFYLGWLDLEGRSGPSGARLAYAGTNIPYYLFGTGLRNEVRYVNVDAHPDWLMHDYHRAALTEKSRPGPIRDRAGTGLTRTSRPGYPTSRPSKSSFWS